MKDKIKEILLCVLYIGVPVGLAIAFISQIVYWWDTPVSECPFWVIWLLK